MIIVLEKNVTSSLEEIPALYYNISEITYILLNYVNRFVSGSGFFLNLIFLRILLDRSLKNTLYNYLWTRSFTNFIVCFLGAGRMKWPDQYSKKSLYQLIYGIYISGLALRIALFASSLSDVLLVINRNSNIVKRQFFLSRISKLTNLCLCYTISACLVLPCFFPLDIVKSENDNAYYWIFNKFGSSEYFKVYLIVTFTISTLLIVILLFILNVISVTKFREIMASLTRERRKAEIAQARFTKFSLVLSVICLIASTLDLISGIGKILVLADPTEYTHQSIILVEFFGEFANMVLFCSHGYECLIYLIIDSNLKKCLMGFFKQK
jgi:hypothetical protein